MADTFQLQVATPERLLVDEQVTEAEIPGKNGYMGILAGHAPLLSALAPGLLTYGSGGSKRVLVVDGGFVEVFENSVRVLADHAEPANEVNADAARRQLDEANQALREAQDEQSSDAALDKMQQAQAKLDAAENRTH
ncbi:MAG: ATP synthase F1 subunit epsilon [Bryobacteraceae bacterium]